MTQKQKTHHLAVAALLAAVAAVLQFFLAKIPYGTIRKIIQIFLFPYF